MKAAKTIDQKTMWQDAKAMLRKAEAEGIQTAWDRLEEQTPHCKFCELGTTCQNCVMGPCRISPKGNRMQRGVCGADADVIVARNFGRFIAGGSAGHSDHGRDLIEVLEAIVEGHTEDYRIQDPQKAAAPGRRAGYCHRRPRNRRGGARLGDRLLRRLRQPARRGDVSDTRSRVASRTLAQARHDAARRGSRDLGDDAPYSRWMR